MPRCSTYVPTSALYLMVTRVAPKCPWFTFRYPRLSGKQRFSAEEWEQGSCALRVAVGAHYGALDEGGMLRCP